METKHDFASEPKITFQDARRLCPGESPPSIVSLWRWARKGVRGVRLEYMRAGRKMFTSAGALTRFFRDVTALDAPIEQKPTPKPTSLRQTRRDRDRQRAVATAKSKLTSVGI